MQQVLRNPSLEPLSVEALRRYSPAIFSKEAHGDVSARYGFFPTYRILEGMHKNGFEPVEVRNYQRRDTANMLFTKHMVRFRQAGTLDARKVGDVVPQIVLINSHDRSSPFELFGGLMRLACLNGMLVSEGGQVRPIKLRHSVNLVETAVEASFAIIKQHRNVFRYIDVMRKTKLTPRAQLAFATAAIKLRRKWPDTINPAAMLEARRTEDAGDDVWHVFNRIQENMTKGGVEGRTSNGRRIVTSAVEAIGTDMTVNAGMWALVMQVIGKASASSKAELKELDA